MTKKFDKVYQFKITLERIRPPVWRRILVPGNYTFWDLHVAIQDAMGWEDYHLHKFDLIGPRHGKTVTIGIPDEDDIDFGWTILAGWKHRIADYFSKDNPKAAYTYDFGDSWDHIVELEKVLSREEGVEYPVCVKGQRACPPEDCGGTGAYDDMVVLLKGPKNEEYQEMVGWIGREYDPDHFDIIAVTFDDPRKRWRTAFR